MHTIVAWAGLVAALTWFLMWDEERTDLSAGPWRYLLPGLLLTVAIAAVATDRGVFPHRTRNTAASA